VPSLRGAYRTGSGPHDSGSRAAVSRAQRWRSRSEACTRPAATSPLPQRGLIPDLLRAYPHDHGQWRLPGGTLKRQDQPAEGLRRELWEELGLDVVSVQLIHSEMHDRSVQLYYRVQVEGVFRPSLEVTGWRPWPLDALLADLWPQQRRAIMLTTTQ